MGVGLGGGVVFAVVVVVVAVAVAVEVVVAVVAVLVEGEAQCPRGSGGAGSGGVLGGGNTWKPPGNAPAAANKPTTEPAPETTIRNPIHEQDQIKKARLT